MQPAVRLALLLAATSGCVSPARAPTPPPAPAPADREARAAWLGLPSTSNGCPEHYDYFPDGGLAIFYCHARSLLTLQRLEALAGMPSTRTPSPGDSPTLAAAFRHYDPRFVEWLRGALLPARRDPRFREQTRPIYQKYVAPLARQYLATRRLMEARVGWTEGEVRWVRERIERGDLPERWYAERYEAVDAPVLSSPSGALTLDRTGWDPNMGPNALAFWIRRELDGSAPAFKAALEELVSLYDEAWLRGGAGLVPVAPTPGARAPAPAAAPPPVAAQGEPLSVAQVWRDRSRLAGRRIVVKGWAVKFDARILGRNWIHLRDGTGTVRDNDLTVTTSDQADVGEVVTIEGTVSVERDFGAGYAYPVILEGARILRYGPHAPMPPGLVGGRAAPAKGAVSPASPPPPETTDGLGGVGGAEIQDHVEAPAETAPEEEPTGARPICGTVREQHPAAPYTFLRLDSTQGEIWAAVPALRIAPGAQVCVLDPIPMNDFRSEKLRRSFRLVYFGRVEP